MLIEDWNLLREAYNLRHLLIHGDQGTTGLDYAADRVERILNASKQVFEFAQSRGVYEHLPRREKAAETVWPKQAALCAAGFIC
jgi:hypothetical protein